MYFSQPSDLVGDYVFPGEESTIPTKPRTYARDWRVPTSFGFWGASAGDRCRLALTVARRVDPEFFWLQVEDPLEPRDAVEHSIVSHIASDHFFVINPEELAPHPELGTMASWIVREDIDADARLRTFADFMRLPNLARDLLDGRSSYSPTKAIAIANSNRAADLYSTEEHGIRPFVEAINECAATIIFTTTKPSEPRNARYVDYLFHLEDDNAEGRSVVSVECRQGAPPGTQGLFMTRYRRDLSALIDEIEQS